MTGRSTGPALPWNFAVDPSIRLGLELPPLDPSAASDHAPVTLGLLGAAVAAAGRAGFGAVWFTGGAGEPGGCDACTLAAGLAPADPSVTLGVVAPLDGARSPALLARDLTALDLVSGGRSAVLLRGGSCLGEAVAVCRNLFCGSVDFTGDCYRLSGAENRPAPVRPGGPQLLAQPDDPGDVAGLGSLEAVVVEGAPSDLEAARRTLGLAVGDGGGPGLVWRGDPGEGPGELRERADLLHRAGAGGLIVRPGGGGGRPGDGLDARVRRLGAVLAPLVDGWHR